MNTFNKRGKLLTIITIIVVVVILGIYSLKSKLDQVNQQFQIPSDWETYTSSQHHFSLKYPPSWGFCDEPSGIGIYPHNAVGWTDFNGVSKKCYNMQGAWIEVQTDKRFDFITEATRERNNNKSIGLQVELVYINGMFGQKAKIINYPTHGGPIFAIKLTNNKYTFYIDYLSQVSEGCSDEAVCNKELETILHSLKIVN